MKGFLIVLTFTFVIAFLTSPIKATFWDDENSQGNGYNTNCPHLSAYVNGVTRGYVSNKYIQLADKVAYFSNNDIHLDLPVQNPDGTTYNVNTFIPKWRGQVAAHEGEDSCLVINIASGQKKMDNVFDLIQLDDFIVPYSVSKFMGRLSSIIAIDKTYFRLKDKIASKLPGFGINGKSDTTFGEFLSNRAGLATSGTSSLTFTGVQFQDMLRLSDLTIQNYNATHTLELFKNSSPRFNVGTEGTEVAYNTLWIGNVLADLIQYFDPQHRSFEDFIKEEWSYEIGNPEFHIGIPINRPDLFSRIAEMNAGFAPIRNSTSYHQLIDSILSIFGPPYQGSLAFNSLYAFPDYAYDIFTGLNPLTGQPRTNPANDPVFLNTFAPAVGFIAPASTYSKMVHLFANDGVYRGERIVRKETIREALKPVLLSQDQTLFTPMCITNVGTWCKTSAYNISSDPVSLNKVTVTGHSGAAGSQVIIDRDPELGPFSLAIMTAQYSTGTDLNPFVPENINQMIQLVKTIRNSNYDSDSDSN